MPASCKRCTDRTAPGWRGPSSAELVGEWDATRLERVVGNLVSNAVKSGPAGGSIEVTLGRAMQGGQLSAVLTVRDHAIGIPAADLPHMFERYHRAANVVGRCAGEGIGLFGARQIVAQHGGTRDALSQEDHGATFTLRRAL